MIDTKRVGLNQTAPETQGLRDSKLLKDLGGGPSFKDSLRSAELSNGNAESLKALAGAPKISMNGTEGVKFSNHAVERMMARGIKFNQEDMTRLNSAVEKAAAKGSKDSLVLMNESALIVSVKNKTVVTVMDKNALKENVFTNIDSTIVM